MQLLAAVTRKRAGDVTVFATDVAPAIQLRTGRTPHAGGGAFLRRCRAGADRILRNEHEREDDGSLSRWIGREDVVSLRHPRVARIPAFGAGPGSLERFGAGVIVKLRECPSVCLREPLRVLLNERDGL